MAEDDVLPDAEAPIDLGLSHSTDPIRYRQFALAKRGYDQDEVHEYLVELAEWIDRLKAGVRQLEARLRESPADRQSPQPFEADIPAQLSVATGVAPDSDPYEELAARVASVVRSAEEYAQRVRSDADSKIEQALAVAGRAADQAQGEAEQILDHARREADRLISDVRPISSATLAAVRDLQRQLLRFAEEMEEHLGTIDEFERTRHETVSRVGESEGSGRPSLEDVVWAAPRDVAPEDQGVVELPDVASTKQARAE